MIKINKINVTENNEHSRLVFNIEDDGKLREIWFEVDKRYGEYLCYERADAILIGILNYAMRKKSDIVSNIPISEELLYNIRENLIPSISNYDKNLHHIKITAPVISEKYNCAGAVGTGISCGVDSFHVLSNFLNSQYKGMNLTHLCINNVGSWSCYKMSQGANSIREQRYEIAEEMAKKLNLELIKSNSNIADEIIQNHLYTNTYSSMFAVHCLAKLFKIYYYASSGHDFSAFNIINSSSRDSGYYDLLSLNCLSTQTLRIYSEGGAKNRFNKTEAIMDNELARNYLHVCLYDKNNCGICEKCKRTLLTLDALNKLENFNKVFNIEFYKKHRREYIYYLLHEHYKHSDYYEPIYQKMKSRITLMDKITYFTQFIFSINHIQNYNNVVIRILGIKISKKRSL